MEHGYCGCCRDGVLKPVDNFEEPLDFITSAGRDDGLTQEDLMRFSLCEECLAFGRLAGQNDPEGFPLVVEATYTQMMIDGQGHFTKSRPITTLFNLRVGPRVTSDRA